MKKRKIGTINDMQEIIAYTEGCKVAEGNIRYAERMYVENSGRERYSYSLYSAGITYTDQQGIEHNFVSEFYDKYFEIGVFRYAPYHLNPKLGSAIISCIISLFLI